MSFSLDDVLRTCRHGMTHTIQYNTSGRNKSVKSISMHACTYIVHIHKCTYALRKCLSYTYRSKWRKESIMWHNCKHAACSSTWMQHNCVVCVWWGDAVTNLFPFSNIHVTHLVLYCLDFYFFQFERGESALVVPWLVSLPMDWTLPLIRC